jgi:hypothetical protein
MLLKSQYYKSLAPTYFGPHWPVIREHTIVQTSDLRFSACRRAAKLVELEYKNTEMGEQSGFRAGRSCIDNIFCITQTIEEKKATNRELHLLFIDLTKTYDTLPLNKLWETLDTSTINTRLTEAIKSLYKESTSKIKIGNLITKGFKVPRN